MYFSRRHQSKRIFWEFNRNSNPIYFRVWIHSKRNFESLSKITMRSEWYLITLLCLSTMTTSLVMLPIFNVQWLLPDYLDLQLPPLRPLSLAVFSKSPLFSVNFDHLVKFLRYIAILLKYVHIPYFRGPMVPGVPPREASERLIIYQSRFDESWRKYVTFSGKELVDINLCILFVEDEISSSFIITYASSSY